MQKEPLTFFSDGLELSGAFFWPDGPDGPDGAASGPPPEDQPVPLVIPCSGFTGLMHIHPERFARYLTAQGQACFSFDYRGFADSEGERGRVRLDEQVRDIVNATTRAAADPRVDGSRVILLGWGMAGGLIVDAARVLPGVIGLACVNGFYNGARVQLAHRGEGGLAEFVRRLGAEREVRVKTGQHTETDPFDIYPLDSQSRAYVDSVLRPTPGYDAQPYSWELGDSLLRFDVEAFAPGMRQHLLVAHGDANQLHPVDEAENLMQAWGGPKELHWIPGAGHTEFMHDDNPTFRALGERIWQWVKQVLA